MIANAGFKSIISSKTGRAAQINKGVMMANGDIICILHADTLVPSDAITVIRDTMRNQSIALASFMPRICGDKGTSWGTSFHNWIKTWKPAIKYSIKQGKLEQANQHKITDFSSLAME